MKSNTSIAKSVLAFVTKGDRARLAFAGLITVAMAYAITRPPVLIGEIVDTAAAQTSESERGTRIVQLLVIAAIFFVVRPILEGLRRRIVHGVAGKASARARASATATILRASHPGADPAHLSVRIARGTDGVEKLLLVAGADLAGVVFQVALAIITVFVVADHSMALAVLAVVPFSLAITTLQIRSEGGVRHELETDRASLDGDQHEVLDGTDVLRGCGAISVEADRIERNGLGLAARAVRHHVRMAGWDLLKAVIEMIAQLAVVGLGAKAVIDGTATPGLVLAAVALQQQLLTPLREIHRVVDEGHQAVVQAKALSKLLQLDPMPRYRLAVTDATSPATPTGTSKSAAISVQNVDVRVPTVEGHDRRLLRDANLTVAVGERLAIIGASGSGKTTLLRLVAGMATPTEGRITLFGADLGSLDDAALLSAIGYLPQRPFVRNGTVAQNLALAEWADAAPDDDQMLEACATLGLADTIAARGGLHDARIERRADGSYNFSGGELQRLALARVVLRRPPVLVLDEPTSALDAASARQVEDLLQTWPGTVVAVTHADPHRWATTAVTVADGLVGSPRSLADSAHSVAS